MPPASMIIDSPRGVPRPLRITAFFIAAKNDRLFLHSTKRYVILSEAAFLAAKSKNPRILLPFAVKSVRRSFDFVRKFWKFPHSAQDDSVFLAALNDRLCYERYAPSLPLTREVAQPLG